MVVTAVDILDAVLLAIILGVLGTWIYLLAYTIRSYRHAPRLDDGMHHPSSKQPRVDIIVPARNEERFIARCLDSLLNQRYSNFRIIAVDDSSSDATARIMEEFASRDGRILFLHAGEKPDGWVGKNWACYQAYLRSDAELLLFTDADSVHDEMLLPLAVDRMVEDGLDALTLVPRLECIDGWTKATLPLLLVFLHSRYSPLRVNSSKHDTGYFFGSYYIIRREVYEAIGTHRSVRNEIIEDGALGAKVKRQGFRMRMFLAGELFSAVWSRDLSSLINGLSRLIIPIYHASKAKAFGVFAITFFLFLFPFLLIIPYSILHMSSLSTYIGASSILTSVIIGVTSLIHSIKGLGISPAYALASPLGSLLIPLGFLMGMRKSKRGVVWRDRSYTHDLYRSEGFRL
ncbi:MAG: glycosyltransferase family 2 protein [Candidatus Nitrosocaldus sp.]|nr:glycosyltransferase [Candidatus Nitrosocaldus sp.]MDW8276099.1 glycosyltransferase family 2 protein [Candidatus Nitrosocaldus sp.]